MHCPVCNDQLMISDERCTFCGYDLRTGKRGHIDPPPAGAAADMRRRGTLQLTLGVLAVLGAVAVLLLISQLFGLLALTGAGGVLGRGMYMISQARRWDQKQRLYDEQQPLLAGAADDTGAPVAVSSTLRDRS
jgi:hypothetical protein